MNDTTQTPETEQMANDEDVKTLHSRVDAMTKKFETCNGQVVDKLNNIATDTALIKKTCETRGKTCSVHVDDMDKTLRGNGGEGVLTRLATNEKRCDDIEKRAAGKEKFAYLIIGALTAGMFSLGVALIMKLVG
ncbi:MAG: hypothetical protein U9N61_09495 [Euryarchaeota archaeon]|nr:hypothetical protein [Euryarchaeota archaeon]